MLEEFSKWTKEYRECLLKCLDFLPTYCFPTDPDCPLGLESRHSVYARFADGRIKLMATWARSKRPEQWKETGTRLIAVLGELDKLTERLGLPRFRYSGISGIENAIEYLDSLGKKSFKSKVEYADLVLEDLLQREGEYLSRYSKRLEEHKGSAKPSLTTSIAKIIPYLDSPVAKFFGLLAVGATRRTLLDTESPTCRSGELLGEETVETMKEPKLEDFGLTEKDVSKYNRYAEVLGWIAASTAILGLGAGICEALISVKGSFLEQLFLGFFFGVIGAVIAGLGGTVVALIFLHLALPLFSNKIRRFRKFQEAKKEFEVWFIRTQVSFWRSLSGRQFEHEFAFLLIKNGYAIKKLSKGSGDKGVDVVAFKDGRKVIVQCKAHKTPIGPGVVRDLFGTLVNEKADRAILASVSGFTQGVLEFADGKPIELIDLNKIIRLSTKEQTQ